MKNDNNVRFESIPLHSKTSAFIKSYIDLPKEINKTETNHFHHSIEILVVEKGQLAVSLINKKYILNENDIIIVNYDVIHNTQIISDNSIVHMVQFNPFDFFSFGTHIETLFRFMNGDNMPSYKVITNRDIQLCTAVYEIIVEYETKQPSYDFVIKSDIYRILAHLIRKKFIVDTSQSNYQKRAVNLIQPILEYIYGNYTSTISLDNICSKFKVSKSYFCKQFKLITNRTFSEYLVFLRTSKAIDMLKETELSITQIAFECGFNSLSYFNKVFKKSTGFTPKDYRKIIV